MSSDTIFALATAAGVAGVSVVRVSGPNAIAALQAVTAKPVPAPRKAVLRAFVDAATGDVIDDGLVLWFPAPHSFTGEDVVEFQGHGGRAVIAALLAALGKVDGLRPAEAGEFTRRAFDNGKLDLTEVEGLADLIAAETEAQRRQALRQSQGELGRLYESWRGDLVAALAYLETTIDFSDEDIPADLTEKVWGQIRALRDRVKGHLADGRRGERLRHGIELAIVGPPNAGKSSLLNWLAQRDAAIVSDIAGTTRDVVEVHLDLGGYPVVVADTAGLRETADAIEEEGVRRALARAEAADLTLLVVDAGEVLDESVAALVGPDTIVAANKIDRYSEQNAPTVAGVAVHPISVSSGDGLSDLLQSIEGEVRERWGLSEEPALTRARHRDALEETLAGLDRALTSGEMELAAEDLRLASRSLGRIVGRVDVEELLDVIFRDFCIGK